MNSDHGPILLAVQSVIFNDSNFQLSLKMINSLSKLQDKQAHFRKNEADLRVTT